MGAFRSHTIPYQESGQRLTPLSPLTDAILIFLPCSVPEQGYEMAWAKLDRESEKYFLPSWYYDFCSYLFPFSRFKHIYFLYFARSPSKVMK